MRLQFSVPVHLGASSDTIAPKRNSPEAFLAQRASVTASYATVPPQGETRPTGERFRVSFFSCES